MSERYCSILNCPVVDPHYHTARGIEFSRMELIEVLAERDALKAERDRLIKETFALSEDRDAWKQKAERLAGALSWFSEEYERGERKGYDMKVTPEMNEEAKAALDEYEQ